MNLFHIMLADVFNNYCNLSTLKLFNRLPNSQNASVMSGGGFMRGTKFRYTGRTEREILTENLNLLRQQHLMNNSSPSKRKANSVPATPSSPQGDLAEIREPISYVNQNNKFESFPLFLFVR